MAGKLDAKVAIITGASSGIGAATAIASCRRRRTGGDRGSSNRAIERSCTKIEAVGERLYQLSRMPAMKPK